MKRHHMRGTKLEAKTRSYIRRVTFNYISALRGLNSFLHKSHNFAKSKQLGGEHSGALRS